MLTRDPWTGLRELTAARLALGRCGHSLPTRELLAFQLAHAQARDAVHHSLDVASLALDVASLARDASSLTISPAIVLQSAAPDRDTYLRRPDFGRRLDAASAEVLTLGNWDAVLVVADGLSATAVHRHALVLMTTLIDVLIHWDAPRPENWRVAPICIVRQARVAIGDEIGERMGARLAVVLIGERPGLSSPDSLGAYLTWAPRIGRTDAERTCVSNIRNGGLEPVLAAQQIAALMRQARDRELTGVNLKTSHLLS
jgi:ethanolamine ammonia-lyase small subunit